MSRYAEYAEDVEDAKDSTATAQEGACVLVVGPYYIGINYSGILQVNKKTFASIISLGFKTCSALTVNIGLRQIVTDLKTWTSQPEENLTTIFVQDTIIRI